MSGRAKASISQRRPRFGNAIGQSNAYLGHLPYEKRSYIMHIHIKSHLGDYLNLLREHQAVPAGKRMDSHEL
jgi:hypothetical protein